MRGARRCEKNFITPEGGNPGGPRKNVTGIKLLERNAGDKHGRGREELAREGEIGLCPFWRQTTNLVS